VELCGGVAVVTGAAGGIGAAVARRLADEGMALVLADRDRERLQRVVDDLPGSTEVCAVVGDVGDPGHHDELIAAAAALGVLRLSVLNAGLYLPGPAWEQSLRAWELHVRVNQWGVIHGIRSAVPALLDAGVGHVVAMASGAGLVAIPGMAPYVATKHAVVGLMESLHHDLARACPDGSVGASVVCPGNVRTPMATHSLEAAGIGPERLSAEGERVARAVRAGTDEGAPATSVADAVVAAVTAAPRPFWVLPQPEVALGALDRVQRLVDGRPPFDLLG
jgi:short-subunit dehydrogenase